MGAQVELTRRGAIRATLKGKQESPDRAVVSHIDTLGAIVKELKDNGRLRVSPIGHWSARFIEGARVTLFTDDSAFRGTVLPLKASGHTYNKEVDTQPVGWEHVELRIDARIEDRDDLVRHGINVGDIIAVDPIPEITDGGYINSRHLDDKAGTAAMLAAAREITSAASTLPVDCHLLFTISEEVGSGASAVLHGDVAEMVSVDNGTVAPGQGSSEFGVTVVDGRFDRPIRLPPDAPPDRAVRQARNRLPARRIPLLPLRQCHRGRGRQRYPHLAHHVRHRCLPRIRAHQHGCHRLGGEAC